MSYGRRPYYIIDNGKGYEFFTGAVIGEDVSATISHDAMAQFIASMWWRDNRWKDLPEGEIGEVIKRGFELRPDLEWKGQLAPYEEDDLD